MKCFEKNNVPPGYTPVEGSKCHATEEECKESCGPCWRCYGKYCQVGEKRYVPSVQLLDPVNYPGYQINISEEYGWVAGTNAVDTVPGPPCNFFFQYLNGDITDRLHTGFVVTVFINRPDLSPTGMAASFRSPCGEIPVKRDLDGFEGRYNLQSITNTGGTFYQPLNVGDNVFELEAYWQTDRFGICPINIKIEEFQQDELPPLPAEYYQCFDAPPDEEGWLPVGDCHATEEECALSCPSVPFCECDEPNVLGNELTMTLQDFKDTGYTPTETENITCTPEQLFSQIKAMSFNAPFFDWYKSDGTIFDIATWGPGSDNLLDGMIAEANCVDDLYLPEFSNTIACQLQEDLGTDCLKYFEEENFNVFPSKVEWTPESVMTSMVITQGGTPQRICDFAKTGTTLLEFDKVYSPEPGEGFGVLARWENLNYISDPAYPWPRFKNLYLAKFRTDMLLSINGTPPGGRTMPATTTGPGTHLKNMLAAFGIKAKEKGCGCKSMEKKMNRLGNACTEPKNLQMIVDHLQAEAKKRSLPFVRKVGEMLVKRAVRKSQQNS